MNTSDMKVEITGYYITTVMVDSIDDRGARLEATEEQKETIFHQVCGVDADGATTWIDFNVEDSGYERKIWSTLESAHKEIQRLIKIPPRRQRPEHGVDGFTALKGELDEACAHSHLTLSGTTKFMITPVIKVVAPIYEQDFTFISEVIPRKKA